MNLYNWNEHNLNESLFNTKIVKKLRDKLSILAYNDFHRNVLKYFGDFDIDTITDDDIEVVYPSELKDFVKSNYYEKRQGFFFSFKGEEWVTSYFQAGTPYCNDALGDADLIIFIDLTDKDESNMYRKRSYRKESKLGILTEHEARMANMERYRHVIMSKIGISSKESMVLSYKHMMSKILNKETAFFIILSQSDQLLKLYNDLNQIIRLCNENQFDGIEGLVERCKLTIGKLYDDKNTHSKKFASNAITVKDYADDDGKSNLALVLKISEMIYNYVMNYDVKTAYDLNNVFNKFNQIYRVFAEGRPIDGVNKLYNKVDDLFSYEIHPHSSSLSYNALGTRETRELEKYMSSILQIR